MRFLVLAALVATACALDSAAPSWPRIPLSVMLRGEKPVYNDDKIVGGEAVSPANSLPFQISLQRCTLGVCSQSCGGSILNANTILNAAHCVSGANVANFRVVACEHELNVVSGKEQNREVSRYTMHQQYSASTFQNDISLIHLTTPLDLEADERCAQPAKLPTQNEQTAAGTTLVVSGWGTTSSGGSISQVLRSVQVPAVSDADCNASYGAGSIYDSMICAGHPQGGVDSCQGDSGGPLFRDDENKVQVGIVSWGYGCAVAGYPGVYTEVSYFIDWIAQNSK